MHFVVRKSDDERRPLSPQVSCFECKLEIVEKKWRLILMNWLSKCVNPEYNEKTLTSQWLVEIINRYKDDICEDDIDRALLCTDDLEPFLRYKYPILRLKTLPEEKDRSKLVYVMASILLFHCCINSQTGKVESDLCAQTAKEDREIILKFCEYLSDMEITINNVETAIRLAFDFIDEKKIKVRSPKQSSELEYRSLSGNSSLKVSSGYKSSVGKSPPRSVTIMASPMISSEMVYSGSVDTTATSNSLKIEDNNVTTSEGGSLTVFNLLEKELMESDSDVKQAKSLDNMVGSLKWKPEDSTKRKYRTKYKTETDSYRLGLKLRPQENYEKSASKHIPNKVKIVDPNECKCNRSSLETCCESSVLTSDPSVYTNKTISDTLKKEERPKKKKIRKLKFDTENRESWMENFKRQSAIQWDNFVIFISVLIMFLKENRMMVALGLGVLLLITTAAGLVSYFISRASSATGLVEHNVLPVPIVTKTTQPEEIVRIARLADSYPSWHWECQNRMCTKVLTTKTRTKNKTNATYPALSRCLLLCPGPQIWPFPIGQVKFGTQLVFLATDKLEYKFETDGASKNVQTYLGEAFKLFIGDLAKLERMELKNKNHLDDINVKKMHFSIIIDGDPDPRLKVNTDESYLLKIDTIYDKLRIKIESQSFAGARHALETLTQMILLDQTTGFLITIDEASIKDGPSYRYRGLMLDTARNYIPLPDILKTLDGMASCKLNTFHWRITDSTSFPLFLPALSNLFEYGAYSRSMVYSKQDIETVVNRAGVRGIRVLLEVALPGPVGRAWSWSHDVTCQKKINNETCDNVMCTHLKMIGRVFKMLEHLYSEIIAMTGVDDVFHLSNGVFSLSNCFIGLDERRGFLEKALDQLRIANKGFIPKLPLIWYTSRQAIEREAKVWERLGVQLYEWPTDPSLLRNFRVIHSSKWDLSCELKKQRCMRYRSWQKMYSWNSWKTIEAFSTEGGEALLWTDLVDSGNLDYHLWPRVAAVAERLWSDIAINSTATGEVFYRLDNYRLWRLVLQALKVQPVWPVWCSFNPQICIEKLQMEKSRK